MHNVNRSIVSKVLIRMPFRLCYTISNFPKMPVKTLSSTLKMVLKFTILVPYVIEMQEVEHPSCCHAPPLVYQGSL